MRLIICNGDVKCFIGKFISIISSSLLSFRSMVHLSIHSTIHITFNWLRWLTVLIVAVINAKHISQHSHTEAIKNSIAMACKYDDYDWDEVRTVHNIFYSPFRCIVSLLIVNHNIISYSFRPKSRQPLPNWASTRFCGMLIKNQKNAMFIGESLARNRKRRQRCWVTMRRVGMLVKRGVGMSNICAENQ